MEPEEKKVEVSKEQLDELIAQNKELLTRNRELADAVGNIKDVPDGVKQPKAVTDRTVRVLFLEGKAVLGFKNRGEDTRPVYVYEKADPVKKDEVNLFVDVILAGEEEPVSTNYNDLLHDAERRECKIVKVDEQEWRVVQGQTSKKVVNNYATEETGIMVPIEVLGKTRTFTVALPDGEEVAIHENYVNM